jgi:hypothetical protein
MNRQTVAIGDQFLRWQELSLILEFQLDTILQLIFKKGVTLFFFLHLVFAFLLHQLQPFVAPTYQS